MTDPTPAGATPAAGGAMPPQTPAEPPATGDPGTSAAPATGADEGLGDAGKRALEAERTARSDAEKRAKAAEGELKKFRDAQLSEDERRTQRLAELERQNAELTAARQVDTLRVLASSTARKLGFRNPDIAHRLLDLASVQYADDGTPKNLESLLGEIAKSEPYLVNATPDFGGGPRGAPAASGVDMNTFIRRATGRA